MMSFNDFIREYSLKDKATSNTMIPEVFKKVRLHSKMRIFLRDGNVSTNYGTLNLQPSKGDHWVCFIRDCCFYAYGCALPKKLPKYIKNKHWEYFMSENQFQQSSSFCASYVSNTLYLTKVLGIDFKSAVLNLYHQTISW